MGYLKLIKTFIRGFFSDRMTLHAASLSFSTILTVVPALAVAFGIAKGFGFEQTLESEILKIFYEQKEIANYIIQFAYSYLEHVKGGVIATVGLLFLFWTVFSLVEKMEVALNIIWKRKKSRSIARKFTDYFSLMFLLPIFFLISSVFTIAVTARIYLFLKILVFQLLPILFVWIFFTFLYIFIPNAKVPLKYAAVGGFFAAILFQLVQWIYISSQIGISGFGAIYGSFAAIPLFMVWILINWMIFLLGGEITYHIEYSSLQASSKRLAVNKRDLAIFIVGLHAKAFKEGNPLLRRIDLANKLGISKALLTEVLNRLIRGGILSKIKSDKKGNHTQIALNPDKIGFNQIVLALESWGNDEIEMNDTIDFDKYVEHLQDYEKKYLSPPLTDFIS